MIIYIISLLIYNDCIVLYNLYIDNKLNLNKIYKLLKLNDNLLIKIMYNKKSIITIVILFILKIVIVSSNNNTNDTNNDYNYSLELYRLAYKLHSNFNSNISKNNKINSNNVKIHLIRVPKASSSSLSAVARRIVGCSPPG